MRRVAPQTSSIAGPRHGLAAGAVLRLLLIGFLLLVFNGCATPPKSVPPPPPKILPPAATAPPPAPVPVKETRSLTPVPQRSPLPPAKATPPAPVVPPATPQGEIVVAIESRPDGALIVVNDIPIGKAPQRLKVQTTSLGFFRDYMTVKARFLATSPDETSTTVEEDCTPLKKIPGAIFFTPQGAQWRP
ncbi:MAG: hypothetical protein ABSE59_03575 [Opitutaceae bacterium]